MEPAIQDPLGQSWPGPLDLDALGTLLPQLQPPQAASQQDYAQQLLASQPPLAATPQPHQRSSTPQLTWQQQLQLLQAQQQAQHPQQQQQQPTTFGSVGARLASGSPALINGLPMPNSSLPGMVPSFATGLQDLSASLPFSAPLSGALGDPQQAPQTQQQHHHRFRQRQQQNSQQKAPRQDGSLGPADGAPAPLHAASSQLGGVAGAAALAALLSGGDDGGSAGLANLPQDSVSLEYNRYLRLLPPLIQQRFQGNLLRHCVLLQQQGVPLQQAQQTVQQQQLKEMHKMAQEIMQQRLRVWVGGAGGAGVASPAASGGPGNPPTIGSPGGTLGLVPGGGHLGPPLPSLSGPISIASPSPAGSLLPETAQQSQPEAAQQGGRPQALAGPPHPFGVTPAVADGAAAAAAMSAFWQQAQQPPPGPSGSPLLGTTFGSGALPVGSPHQSRLPQGHPGNTAVVPPQTLPAGSDGKASAPGGQMSQQPPQAALDTAHAVRAARSNSIPEPSASLGFALAPEHHQRLAAMLRQSSGGLSAGAGTGPEAGAAAAAAGGGLSTAASATAHFIAQLQQEQQRYQKRIAMMSGIGQQQQQQDGRPTASDGAAGGAAKAVAGARSPTVSLPGGKQQAQHGQVASLLSSPEGMSKATAGLLAALQQSPQQAIAMLQQQQAAAMAAKAQQQQQQQQQGGVQRQRSLGSAPEASVLHQMQAQAQPLPQQQAHHQWQQERQLSLSQPPLPAPSASALSPPVSEATQHTQHTQQTGQGAGGASSSRGGGHGGRDPRRGGGRRCARCGGQYGAKCEWIMCARCCRESGNPCPVHASKARDHGSSRKGGVQRGGSLPVQGSPQKELAKPARTLTGIPPAELAAAAAAAAAVSGALEGGEEGGGKESLAAPLQRQEQQPLEQERGQQAKHAQQQQQQQPEGPAPSALAAAEPSQQPCLESAAEPPLEQSQQPQHPQSTLEAAEEAALDGAAIVAVPARTGDSCDAVGAPAEERPPLQSSQQPDAGPPADVGTLEVVPSSGDAGPASGPRSAVAAQPGLAQLQPLSANARTTSLGHGAQPQDIEQESPAVPAYRGTVVSTPESLWGSLASGPAHQEQQQAQHELSSPPSPLPDPSNDGLLDMGGLHLDLSNATELDRAGEAATVAAAAGAGSGGSGLSGSPRLLLGEQPSLAAGSAAAAAAAAGPGAAPAEATDAAAAGEPSSSRDLSQIDDMPQEQQQEQEQQLQAVSDGPAPELAQGSDAAAAARSPGQQPSGSMPGSAAAAAAAQQGPSAAQRDVVEVLRALEKEREDVGLWRRASGRHNRAAARREVLDAVDRYLWNVGILAEVFDGVPVDQAPLIVEESQGFPQLLAATLAWPPGRLMGGPVAAAAPAESGPPQQQQGQEEAAAAGGTTPGEEASGRLDSVSPRMRLSFAGRDLPTTPFASAAAGQTLPGGPPVAPVEPSRPQLNPELLAEALTSLPQEIHHNHHQQQQQQQLKLEAQPSWEHMPGQHHPPPVTLGQPPLPASPGPPGQGAQPAEPRGSHLLSRADSEGDTRDVAPHGAPSLHPSYSSGLGRDASGGSRARAEGAAAGAAGSVGGTLGQHLLAQAARRWGGPEGLRGAVAAAETPGLPAEPPAGDARGRQLWQQQQWLQGMSEAKRQRLADVAFRMQQAEMGGVFNRACGATQVALPPEFDAAQVLLGQPDRTAYQL
ncbi:hypothetical protein N2152v2_000866 [Parachlorella kessleri]